MTSSDTMELRADTVVQVRPQVLFRQIEQEAVVLDPDRGLYFGLDEVGTRIWALLQAPSRLGAIHEALLEEYEVTAETLWQDLEALINRLIQHGLVEIRP